MRAGGGEVNFLAYCVTQILNIIRIYFVTAVFSITAV